MWLVNGIHRVLTSPQGGSILQWEFGPQMILGPSRIVQVGDVLKLRGETHWCFPNFGKASEGPYTQPQHGYLRDWVLSDKSHSPTWANFASVPPSAGGPALQVDTSVQVYPNGFSAGLKVSNGEKERVPILPALHPYFAVPKQGLIVTVGGETVAEVGLGIVSGVSKDSQTIERSGRLVAVQLHGIGEVHLNLPDHCSHVVIWSDEPTQYVCVEPIFGKPKTYGTAEGRWIEPGQEIICDVYFDLRP